MQTCTSCFLPSLQAVSLALSSGGSMECGYGTTWTDGDITLNSGKLRLSRSSALTSRPLHSFSRVLVCYRISCQCFASFLLVLFWSSPP